MPGGGRFSRGWQRQLRRQRRFSDQEPSPSPSTPTPPRPPLLQDQRALAQSFARDAGRPADSDSEQTPLRLRFVISGEQAKAMPLSRVRSELLRRTQEHAPLVPGQVGPLHLRTMPRTADDERVLRDLSLQRRHVADLTASVAQQDGASRERAKRLMQYAVWEMRAAQWHVQQAQRRLEELREEQLAAARTQERFSIVTARMGARLCQPSTRRLISCCTAPRCRD